MRKVTDLRNIPVVGTQRRIGFPSDVYFDHLTWSIRYLVVHASEDFGCAPILVRPDDVAAFDERRAVIRSSLSSR